MPNTRKKLIELIRSFENKHNSIVPDKDGLADHLIAHGVTVQKWIPVAECKPPVHPEKLEDLGESISYMESEPFLAYTDKGCIVVCVYSYENGHEWWCEDGGTNHKVTHWMPLPEPPKEG